MTHILVHYYLLLWLIEHSDQIIPACEFETVIKANVVQRESFLARIHHFQTGASLRSGTCSGEFSESTFLILWLSCSLALFFPLSLSQQWKSLFDKVCRQATVASICLHVSLIVEQCISSVCEPYVTSDIIFGLSLKPCRCVAQMKHCIVPPKGHDTWGICRIEPDTMRCRGNKKLHNSAL